MKTLIVATDFSAPAEKAMLYAGAIASSIKAEIIILHVYQIPVSMSEVPVMMISAEELKNVADDGLHHAKATLLRRYPDLSVRTESRMGDITDELDDLCKSTQPFALVTGRHGSSGLERFFFGSTSLSIVRHAHIPVIVVPEQAELKLVSQIALAIDDLKEVLPEEKIRNFISALDARLHIIHVQGSKSGSKELDDMVSFLGSKCYTIHDDDFMHGIQTYLTENKIDLLITIPHKHSFVERLTFRTHTEELLKKLEIPVACISEE